MKFTDRFIKIPVSLYDTANAEMIGYSEETKFAETYAMVNPLEISWYRPGTDDYEKLTETVCYFRSGRDYTFKININDFEKLLNDR